MSSIKVNTMTKKLSRFWERQVNASTNIVPMRKTPLSSEHQILFDALIADLNGISIGRAHARDIKRWCDSANEFAWSMASMRTLQNYPYAIARILRRHPIIEILRKENDCRFRYINTGETVDFENLRTTDGLVSHS